MHCCIYICKRGCSKYAYLCALRFYTHRPSLHTHSFKFQRLQQVNQICLTFNPFSKRMNLNSGINVNIDALFALCN